MGIETVAFLAVTAAGTALKVVGDLAKGKQEQAAYEAKSQADMFNAQVANARAASERAAAAAQAQDVERTGSAKLGQMLALRGGTGVTEAGSPMMVDSQTVREIALGVSRTKYIGEKRALALQDESSLLQSSAAFASRAGGIARETSYLTAGSSLLSGAASAYSGVYGPTRGR